MRLSSMVSLMIVLSLTPYAIGMTVPEALKFLKLPDNFDLKSTDAQKEITQAYRKRALKKHPDKRFSDPAIIADYRKELKKLFDEAATKQTDKEIKEIIEKVGNAIIPTIEFTSATDVFVLTKKILQADPTASTKTVETAKKLISDDIIFEAKKKFSYIAKNFQNIQDAYKLLIQLIQPPSQPEQPAKGQKPDSSQVRDLDTLKEFIANTINYVVEKYEKSPNDIPAQLLSAFNDTIMNNAQLWKDNTVELVNTMIHSIDTLPLHFLPLTTKFAIIEGVQTAIQNIINRFSSPTNKDDLEDAKQLINLYVNRYDMERYLKKQLEFAKTNPVDLNEVYKDIIKNYGPLLQPPQKAHFITTRALEIFGQYMIKLGKESRVTNVAPVLLSVYNMLNDFLKKGIFYETRNLKNIIEELGKNVPPEEKPGDEQNELEELKKYLEGVRKRSLTQTAPPTLDDIYKHVVDGKYANLFKLPVQDKPVFREAFESFGQTMLDLSRLPKAQNVVSTLDKLVTLFNKAQFSEKLKIRVIRIQLYEQIILHTPQETLEKEIRIFQGNLSSFFDGIINDKDASDLNKLDALIAYFRSLAKLDPKNVGYIFGSAQQNLDELYKKEKDNLAKKTGEEKDAIGASLLNANNLFAEFALQTKNLDEATKYIKEGDAIVNEITQTRREHFVRLLPNDTPFGAAYLSFRALSSKVGKKEAEKPEEKPPRKPQEKKPTVPPSPDVGSALQNLAQQLSAVTKAIIRH
jgi:curved DNA-binding protein CbpA